jgi:SAM-dependent methyltransferase
MTTNLYDGHYGRLAADVEREVRRETWDEDVGQASWITMEEAREWFRLLRLRPGRRVLDVACGSGGLTCRMAAETGASAAGVDLNGKGIEAARAAARREGLGDRVAFVEADAARPLPFPDASFDAVFCNDAINHLPDRAAVLADWRRLLGPGGRLLFTDPIVVTGQLTNAEIRTRSAIGFFLFTPPGVNERLLEKGGFSVEKVRDVTGAVASVARRWGEARTRRREALVALEGAEEFERWRSLLEVADRLASERRLSRFAYLARRSEDAA